MVGTGKYVAVGSPGAEREDGGDKRVLVEAEVVLVVTQLLSFVVPLPTSQSRFG